MKKCVITGVGLVCALGETAEECFEKAINGICEIKEVDSVDTELCYAHKGGENKTFVTPDGEDRASALCIKATGEALADAKLDVSSVADRCGVIMGSCVGGAVSIEKYYRAEAENNGTKEDVLKMPISAIANNVAREYNLKGVVDNIANACAAGTMSIARACELIRSGKADVVVAGGSDPMSALAFSGFIALHAIDNDVCSPFNRSQGISLGEGSGVVVVESAEFAAKRGARVYAEVLGNGASSDAHHITAPAPDGSGQMTSMRRALAHSGIEESDINYINAHGTGTPLNDSSESKSMLTLFGGNKDVCGSSNKSMFGHCLGAAGSVEAVMCIKAIEKGIAPPTSNFSEEQIEQAKEKLNGFDIIPNKGKECKLDYVLSNNYAFGGNNASIVYAKEGVVSNIKERTDEKIYITGIGAVTTLGNKVENVVANINEGVLPADIDGRVGSYESKVSTEEYTDVDIKLSFYRKLDKMSCQTCVSGKYALRDAGIEITEENCGKVGMVVGTSDGPQTAIANFQKNIIANGNHKGSAFVFPNTVYNACGGYLSICTGMKGYTVTISNGFASGMASAMYIYDTINSLDEDIMLSVGSDENSESIHALYEKLGAFNADFKLGEGAVTIALEKESSANTRGVRKYAEVIGCGYAHSPAPFGEFGDSDSIIKAVDNAIASAGILADDISVIYGMADGLSGTEQADAKLKAYLSNAKYENIIKVAGEGRAATSSLSLAVAALQLAGDVKKDYEANIAVVVSGSVGGTFTAMLIKKA